MLVGGIGQLGQSLAPALKYIYGEKNILTTDIHKDNDISDRLYTEYKRLDALDYTEYKNLVRAFSPTIVLHLSAILSGNLISQRRTRT